MALFCWVLETLRNGPNWRKCAFKSSSWCIVECLFCFLFTMMVTTFFATWSKSQVKEANWPQIETLKWCAKISLSSRKLLWQMFCHRSTKATNMILYLWFDLLFDFVIFYIFIYSLKILIHALSVFWPCPPPTLPYNSSQTSSTRSSPNFMSLFKNSWNPTSASHPWDICISLIPLMPRQHWITGVWEVMSHRLRRTPAKQTGRGRTLHWWTHGACGCLPVRPAQDQTNQNSSIGQRETCEIHP